MPAADVFPMMDGDELRELAEDIRVNGLREPLVLAEIKGEDVLVDGRNRRAACKIAEVEPDWASLVRSLKPTFKRQCLLRPRFRPLHPQLRT